jgi:predicted enzyme related to lactoylglutathione lyase
MPAGIGGQVLHRRIRGGRRRRRRSIPEGAPPNGHVEHLHLGRERDEATSKVLDAGGKVLMEPFDVMDAGRMAVFADPEGAVFCVWQAKEHKGAQS